MARYSVKPAEAEALLEDGDYLSWNERMVFLFLLRRGDNEDCSIPKTVTPRLAMIARRCRLSPRTLRRYLAHLHLHGWIRYEAAQGSGRKGRIDVAPRVPDLSCHCKKVAPAETTMGGPSCDRLKVASSTTVVPAQRASSARGREGGKWGESTALAHLPVAPVQPSPVLTVVPDPAPDDVDDGPSNVVSISRRKYPSTWCTAAERLWSLGYDA